MHLTLMKTDLGSRVFKRVEAQIVNDNWNAKDRQFELDDPVFVKNFSTTGPVWLARIIIEKKGPLTFHIELADDASFDHTWSTSNNERVKKRMNNRWTGMMILC